MIITHVDHLERYINVTPYMKYLVEYFRKNDYRDIQVGKIDIHEDKVFGNCFTYFADGNPGDFFETHYKYIDVHMVVENIEKMTVTTTANAKITKEYDKEKDIVFYGGDYEQVVSLHPGYVL